MRNWCAKPVPKRLRSNHLILILLAATAAKPSATIVNRSFIQSSRKEAFFSFGDARAADRTPPVHLRQ